VWGANCLVNPLRHNIAPRGKKKVQYCTPEPLASQLLLVPLHHFSISPLATPNKKMAVAVHSYFLLLSLIIQTSTQQTCFWPDGSSADDSTHQCPTSVYSTSDSATVPCCIGPDTCLTNGLCLSGYGNTYRGGCTSKDWNGCPDYCTKGLALVFDCRGWSCRPGFCLPLCSEMRKKWVLQLLTCVTCTEYPSGTGDYTHCEGYGAFCCGLTPQARTCCDGTNSSTSSFIITYVATPALPVSISPSGISTSTSSLSSKTASGTPSPHCTSSCPEPKPCLPDHSKAIGAGLGTALGLAIVAVIAQAWIYRSGHSRTVDRTVEAGKGSQADPGIAELHGLSSGRPELEPRR